MSDPMDAGTAAALGALQGLTEFLPVSSDGHLAVGAVTLGVPDMSLSMVVMLHAGTLLATAVVLARDVKELGVETARGFARPRAFLATDAGKTMAGVVVASLPTAVIGLLLEDHVEALSHVMWVVGACFLVSALFLVATGRVSGDRTTLGLVACLVVGLAQGLAVLPGLSRSGATISTAMLLGLRGPEAFRFSFLLSLPAVGGAVLLKLLEPGALASVGGVGLLGAAVAFVIGVASLLLLRRFVQKGRLWAFALYLVPLGLGVIVWDLST